ncbi:glycosyl hydrolase family 18 protein [Ammoniphilus sp. YIM 78166]|uniref:glycosyl hydrolase family 18 protein n=1 Tax=Ammoniphilus sp. YIM 78166 TaxID=1644106 RepID=UPI00106F7C22|nr:glycosyl hydrolase family 18 protein [Ammoniphilus sp. YIM 78166]
MDIETTYHPRRRLGKGPNRWVLFLLGAICLLGIGITGVLWYQEQVSNHKQVNPLEQRTTPVLHQAEWLSEEDVAVINGELYFSFDYMKEKVDPDIIWDDASKSIVITTKDKVLQFVEGQVEAFVNEKPFSIRFPVEDVNGVKFIPAKPFEQIYPFQIRMIEDTGIWILEKRGDMIQTGKTVVQPEKADVAYRVRLEPSKKSPWILELGQAAQVEIYGENQGWYQLRTEQGYVGFISKQDVELDQIIRLDWEMEDTKRAAWSPLGRKLNVTWEHVVNRNPDHSKIPPMPGLNVVSPTWFHMINATGDIDSKASLPYVEWAHQQGYQVWGLFSNNFDPDMTTEALATYETRSHMIRQLIQYASMYKLDGINIDFENVYLKDKDNFVQFVRELTPYLHEQNLVVSLDVTIKSQSERWSLFYDRTRLAQVVDYVMVMTYDEHWGSSPVAGSVASLPWVEKGLQGVLEEVPASKLLLGVPYYTRLWKEEKDPGTGQVKVTSKALTMDTVDKWIKERSLTPVYDEASGQRFVQYLDPTDGATYKIWLEDELSMKKRAELVKKYDLAGIASWRRGFEKPGIWKVIDDTLGKRN